MILVSGGDASNSTQVSKKAASADDTSLLLADDNDTSIKDQALDSDQKDTTGDANNTQTQVWDRVYL